MNEAEAASLNAAVRIGLYTLEETGLVNDAVDKFGSGCASSPHCLLNCTEGPSAHKASARAIVSNFECSFTGWVEPPQLLWLVTSLLAPDGVMLLVLVVADHPGFYILVVFKKVVDGSPLDDIHELDWDC